MEDKVWYLVETSDGKALFLGNAGEITSWAEKKFPGCRHVHVDFNGDSRPAMILKKNGADVVVAIGRYIGVVGHA